MELRLLRIYRPTNLRKRQNFKQVHENRRLKPSITMGCFKCRHQKSYLMDWSRWSYDGFCQCHTGCCNVFVCWAPIGWLSVVLEYFMHMPGCLYIWSWGTIYRSHDTNHIQHCMRQLRHIKSHFQEWLEVKPYTNRKWDSGQSSNGDTQHKKKCVFLTRHNMHINLL